MNLTQLEQKVQALSARVDNLAVGGAVGVDFVTSPSAFTSTSLATLGASYPIAANDGNQGTTYRYITWGDLQIGSTVANSFRWSMTAYGKSCNTTPSVASVGIGGAPLGNWPGGSFLEWVIEMIMQVETTGSSGAVTTFIRGSLAKYQGPAGGLINLGNTIGATNDNYTLAGGDLNVTTDLTSATNYGLSGFWGGAGTGQSVRYMGSTFERLGP